MNKINNGWTTEVDDEEDDWAKRMSKLNIATVRIPPLEYIGGSFEVLFFDGNNNFIGYTKWIPLDFAERIAISEKGGNCIVQVASTLRDYEKPLNRTLGSYEIKNKENFKHQTRFAPISECYDFFQVVQTEKHRHRKAQPSYFY